MKKNVRKKWFYQGIYLLSTIFLVLSIVYMIKFFLVKQESIEERNLLNTVPISEQVENVIIEEKIEENLQDEVEPEEVVQETQRMLQVKSLQQENPDIVGWIEIENTKINYPVLQGTDNEYYLNHNYKKQKTQKGSIFLNKDYNWDIPSSNLQIYGHNMKNGEMFQGLLKYKNESYYKQHPTIRFTTAKEDAIYEIISVFPSRVYYQTEKNVFRYYYFIHAETKEEYDNFVENAKKASLYEIDKTAEYGDQLMTLSTCSYHTEDGRFVVIARKADET